MDDKELKKRLGQQLRKYRKLKQLTIEEVAEKAGISDKHLGRIERGEKDPSATMLIKLTQVLNVPCTFFNDINENNSQSD